MTIRKLYALFIFIGFFNPFPTPSFRLSLSLSPLPFVEPPGTHLFYNPSLPTNPQRELTVFQVLDRYVCYIMLGSLVVTGYACTWG
ncbi:hypothetical protein F4775DRAFT_580561 [Biscogniauxia sp. FL1348]|nr:hypothetical protein F4775DRAFT_580561 [Biscogniauxia sp. FL1348]